MTKKTLDKKTIHVSKTAPILGRLEAEDGMADWEANWGRDALERIVILLFALANLADRAAGASFLRRRRVLGIVNRGETEARAFIVGIATGEAVEADALEPSGDTADLAVRLRALALMLCLLLAQAPLSSQSGAAGPQVGPLSHTISGPMGRRVTPPPVPDTS